MRRGPKGEKCLGDVIGAAITVGKIATGEIEDITTAIPPRSRLDPCRISPLDWICSLSMRTPSMTAALRSSLRSPPSRCATTASATPSRQRPIASRRYTGANPMSTSIRVPRAKVSTQRCSSGYQRGHRCWTPATSIMACFRPSCCTVTRSEPSAARTTTKRPRDQGLSA